MCDTASARIGITATASKTAASIPLPSCLIAFLQLHGKLQAGFIIIKPEKKFVDFRVVLKIVVQCHIIQATKGNIVVSPPVVAFHQMQCCPGKQINGGFINLCEVDFGIC